MLQDEDYKKEAKRIVEDAFEETHPFTLLASFYNPGGVIFSHVEKNYASSNKSLLYKEIISILSAKGMQDYEYTNALLMFAKVLGAKASSFFETVDFDLFYKPFMYGDFPIIFNTYDLCYLLYIYREEYEKVSIMYEYIVKKNEDFFDSDAHEKFIDSLFMINESFSKTFSNKFDRLFG